MKMKIKGATVARIGALIVVLANECLALFGKAALPFTDNMVYQVISLIFTVIIAGVNCWYNQDVSQVALLCGKIFDSFGDGKITEEEIEQIIAEAAKAESEGYTSDSFLVAFANIIIKNVKEKKENSLNKSE